MKLRLSILLMLSSISVVKAQIDVFECNSYINQVTQAEMNAAAEHYGTCFRLGGTPSISISGSANKQVIASQEIQLKENFYAGSFNTTGGVQLKIALKSGLDISAMNYTNLNSVLRYKKFELGVKLPPAVLSRVNHFLLQEGVYSDELNPFLEWDLDIETTFYHPATGVYKTIDGYYHREYVENTTTNDWDDIGTDYPFRIRYAPPQNGKWIAKVTIKIKNVIAYNSEWFGFNVVESGDPGYVYVHTNKKNLMRGNNMIFPVGHNFHSADENTYFTPWRSGVKASDVEQWNQYLSKIESYFQQGGRYFRTLQTPWSSLIEFEKKGNYYDRLHYAWEQDKLLDLCDQYDALMMFNMMIHTPFVDCDGGNVFHWDWNRYWRDGDGPYYYRPNETIPVYCYNNNPQESNGKMPHHALSNANDLEYHQQRTRYYIARYGYSTKIYEFELLSEPFNVNANAKLDYRPYEGRNITNPQEQQDVFDAVEAYSGSLSWFIKEKMGHTEHLIGVDYNLNSWESVINATKIDQSLLHGNVDIIGVNYYAQTQNKYIITKGGSTNNTYLSNENSRARAVKDFQFWANKPVIISEFGDGDSWQKCANYTGNYVDVMSAGFIGVCGFNLWEGKDTPQNFLWPATIRALQHMNGTNVITTLANGNGQWVQGRQMEKIHDVHETEAKELQYYISYNKEQAVGYVRNRSYNVHTNRINEDCNLNEYFDGNNIPVDYFLNIAWNNGSVGKRLKVQGLKNNTNYQIDFYSFKTGTYMYTDCDNTSLTGGELVIRFPELTVESGYEKNPVVWFVVRQNNCMNGLMQSENIQEMQQAINRGVIENNDQETEANRGSIIYPNPFDDYFSVQSDLEDILIVQTVDGRIIVQQKIDKGVSKINTDGLLNGTYIVKLITQGIQTKLIKQ